MMLRATSLFQSPKFSLLRFVILILLLSLSGGFFFTYHGAVARPFGDESTDPQIQLSRASFPRGFVFGAGTAAYEIEGAVKEGCKGISSWDVYTHEYPEKILDGSNGDVAIDSYHHYKEDSSLLRDIGLNAYRFSISWARILPNGSLNGGICEEGIQHYNDVIDDLISKGLQPFVTLLHSEYPQTLIRKYQGFLSEEFVDDYCDFVNICFREFGDRVKHWITINEPQLLSVFAYSIGRMPPVRCSSCQGDCAAGDSCTEPYIAGHNLLLAHAAAVQLYREKYQAFQKGQIGITLSSGWYKPNSTSKPDYEAALRAQDFTLGWFLDPITQGDYPFTMRALVRDRLPRLTKRQSSLVKGSFDFIGINYYVSMYIQSLSLLEPISCCSYDSDSYTFQTTRGTCAPGLEEALLYIKENYNNPAIYITENGIGEDNKPHTSIAEALQDYMRIEYHKEHLYFLQRAITKGVNVKGYFVWSLFDSFQWNFGYARKFGIVYVDYKNDFKRYPKKSANWFQAFLTQPTEGNYMTSIENIEVLSALSVQTH